MQGHVTRSGQVTTPYKYFTIAPQLQCLGEGYETFVNMIGPLVPTKCISRIFDICDLKSGHFCDLSIMYVNGQKLNSLFYALS